MKVGCAGILVEDIFCGPVDGLPPAGGLVKMDALPTKAGGCAANVALGLAHQGLSVDVAGCVGEDAAGDFLLNTFKQQGINTRHISRCASAPTSRTVILLLRGEDRRYFHTFGANAEFSMVLSDADWADSLDALYAGGVLAMPGLDLRALAEIFRRCRARGTRTFLDVVVPGGASTRELDTLAPVLKHTDFFLPNDDEAATLTGCDSKEAALDALRSLGVENVIITCGEKGAVAANASGKWRCEAVRIDCIDPSGAGDAYCTGAIAASLAGRDLPGLLGFAAVLGASATRALGTTDGIFSRSEASDFFAAHPPKVQPL